MDLDMVFNILMLVFAGAFVTLILAGWLLGSGTVNVQEPLGTIISLIATVAMATMAVITIADAFYLFWLAFRQVQFGMLPGAVLLFVFGCILVIATVRWIFTNDTNFSYLDEPTAHMDFRG